MLLRALDQLRDRIDADVIPTHHKVQSVRWILDLDKDGSFIGLTETGAKKADWLPLVAPYAKRTSRLTPFLLVDKPDYVLGHMFAPPDPEEKEIQKAAARHEGYCGLLRDCVEDTGLKAVQAVLDFSVTHRSKAVEEAEGRGIKKDDLIAPRVKGRFPSDLAKARQFWSERQDVEAAETSTLTAECLVCGVTGPIARTHGVELVVGGKRVGLVAADKAAFRSFGLEKSENAPMCHRCSVRYGEALRYLLQSDGTHLRLADTTWLFWTKEGTDFDISALLSRPEPEEVRQLLKAPFGAHPPGEEPDQFYALVVSSNTSRLVVRGWIEVALAEAHRNLARYFERQGLVKGDGELHHFGLYALAGSLVPERNRQLDWKHLHPQTLPVLLENALTGRPLPPWLLAQAIRRAHAEREHPVTASRAALIKLVLLSDSEDSIVSASLREDHPNPAYHCGRLLAVLDDIQQRAINPNATIVDRFYGSASSTPGTVFGILLRKAQPHLGKLRSTNPGLTRYFEKLLGRIMSELDDFPATLTLRDQGLFALGFYQQKHSRGKKASDEPDDEKGEE